MSAQTRPTDTDLDEALLDALVANTISAARSVREPRPWTAFLRASAVERHDRMRGVLEGLAVAIAVTLDLDLVLVLDIVNAHDAVTEPGAPTRETRTDLVERLLLVAGRRTRPAPDLELEGAR